MSNEPKLEIPIAVRQVAEQSVEQTRVAYNQFMEMARQASDMLAKSTAATAESAQEMQAKALRYAEQNANASFSFASDLARARDLQEYMEIQTRFAQRQMQAYAEQAQELGRLMATAAQKVPTKP